MPLLPDPNALGRVNPNPSSSVAQYQGGIAEAAQSRAGQTIAAQGDSLVAMADQRQSQLDQLRVIEASTELRNKELDLTAGKDGYQNVRGGDVLKRPINEEYTSRFKTAADGISDTLSPRQREMFAGHVAASEGQFQAGVMRHSMAEVEKYNGQVFKADIESRIGYVSAGDNYRNPLVIGKQMEGADAAAAAQIKTLGMTDPTQRALFITGIRGGINSAVIEQAILRGDTEYADEYLKANSKDMTADQRQAMEAKLKPAADFDKGKSLAAEAIALSDEADKKGKLFVATDWLMTKTNNPAIYSAAHTLVNQHRQEVVAQDQELSGTPMLAFMKAGADNQALIAMQNSPEFRALDPKHQVKALVFAQGQVEHAENRANAMESRAYTREQRIELQTNKITPDKLTRYYQLTSDPRFAKMTVAQVASFADTMGTKLTQDAMKELDDQQKGIAKTKIDPVLLQAGHAAAGLSGRGKEAERDQFSAVVDIALREWKEDHPNQKLTTADEQKLISQATVKWTQINSFINKEIPTYALTPAQAGKVIPTVEMQKIEEAAKAQGVSISDKQKLEVYQRANTPVAPTVVAPAAPAVASTPPVRIAKPPLEPLPVDQEKGFFDGITDRFKAAVAPRMRTESEAAQATKANLARIAESKARIAKGEPAPNPTGKTTEQLQSSAPEAAPGGQPATPAEIDAQPLSAAEALPALEKRISKPLPAPSKAKPSVRMEKEQKADAYALTRQLEILMRVRENPEDFKALAKKRPGLTMPKLDKLIAAGVERLKALK